MSQSSQSGVTAPSSEANVQPEGPKKSPWRLILTGLGGVALFWASWKWGDENMTRWSMIPGLIIALIGLMWRIWATGWLQKNEQLATAGPYAFTRNPLYLGTFLLTLGQALMSGLAFAPIVFPIALLWFYAPTMRTEEEYLSQRHGAAFDQYRKRVPLFLPRFSSAKSVSPLSDNAFQWPRVKRCWKGFLGNILVIAFYFFLDFTR